MSKPADWVPSTIRWSASGPRVEWCHLGALRFTDPFFEQTLERAMMHPFNLLFAHRTPLVDLMKEAKPDLRLAGLIFHMSRCGSTVVTQMLAALTRNVVLSEPAPIDQILRIWDRLPDVPQPELVQCLRGMVAALGRRRRFEERDLFVKLDAWHILRLPLIRSAFPDVPWIFLYRDPVEVMASIAKWRPAQMFPGRINPALLGMEQSAPLAMPLDEYGARVLETVYTAALQHRGGLLVQYGELPEAACGKVLDHFGLPYGQAELAAMRAAAQMDAKNPALRFQPDGEAKQRGASEEIRALAEKRLAPLYARLEALRLAG